MITRDAYLDLDEPTPADDAAEYRAEEAAIWQALSQAWLQRKPEQVASELARVLMDQYKYHDTLERQSRAANRVGLDKAEFLFLLDVREFLLTTRSTLAVAVLREMIGGL